MTTACPHDDSYQINTTQRRCLTCGYQFARLVALTDDDALNQIAALLTGAEWDSDTAGNVAAIVRLTGRAVDDTNIDEDDTAGEACADCARSYGPHYHGPCPH